MRVYFEHNFEGVGLVSGHFNPERLQDQSELWVTAECDGRKGRALIEASNSLTDCVRSQKGYDVTIKPFVRAFKVNKSIGGCYNVIQTIHRGC